MLRGYRGYVIAAVCGLIFIVLASAGYKVVGKAEDQPYPSYKYQPARDHLPWRAAKYPGIAPTPYEPHCDDPKERDDADLCAQWAGVQAVEESNRLARISLRITTLEFTALIVSLVFTGWAALAAAKATKIAEAATKDADQALEIASRSADASARMAEASRRGNLIAKQASIAAANRAIKERKRGEQAERRRLRAYLTISHLQAAQIGNVGEPLWDIQAVWSNNGLTPAVAAITHANLGIFYDAPPPDFDYPDDGKRSQNAPLPVGPSQVLHCKVPPIRGGEAMRLFKREGHAFAWGWIEYQDVFGPEIHRTEFSFRLETWHDGKSFQVAFMPYGQHNGIDDSCMKQPSQNDA